MSDSLFVWSRQMGNISKPKMNQPYRFLKFCNPTDSLTRGKQPKAFWLVWVNWAVKLLATPEYFCVLLQTNEAPQNLSPPLQINEVTTAEAVLFYLDAATPNSCAAANTTCGISKS